MITFINESIGGNMRIKLNAISFIFYSGAGVFLNLVSIYINRYTFYLTLCLVLFSLSSISYFFFLETPFYFYKKKDICALHECLLAICKRNFGPVEFETQKETIESMLKFSKNADLSIPNKISLKNGDENEDENGLLKSKTVAMDLPDFIDTKDFKGNLTNSGDTGKEMIVKNYLEFFTKKNLFKYSMICVILLSAECMFGISQILNKDLGISNIYLSGTLIVIFQLFGYGICSYLSTRVGRKKINQYTNIILISLGSVLLTLNLVSNSYQPYSQRGQFYRISETGILIRNRAAHADDQFRSIWHHLLLHNRTVQHQNQELRHVSDFDLRQNCVRLRNVFDSVDEFVAAESVDFWVFYFHFVFDRLP